MRASIALASVVVLVGTNLASASEAKLTGLAVATDPSGNLVVRDGDKAIASFTPKTEAKQRGVATARQHQVAGRGIVEVRLDAHLPVAGAGPSRQEVWIAERTASAAKVIWWDWAGAIDPDGETSTVADVSDAGIHVYQTAARVSRCDGLPVRLSEKAWDFATGAFKAVRGTLPPRAAVSVQARRGGAPEGKPLGGFFFSAASTSIGAGADPGRLKPPLALNDGNPATVWSTEGDARGHLLTARSSGGFAISGLRLLPGDPGSERGYRASGKPRKLSLIFGKNPSENLDVELLEDSDGGVARAKVPYWIKLPKPVASGCVTVVVRETAPDKGPMSIADMEVMTELDGPEAADRLVDSLSQGNACAARQPLLVRLGEAALVKVAVAIQKAPPGPGRECLVEALAALVDGNKRSPEIDTALVAAMVRASSTEEKIVLKLLADSPEPPVSQLAAVLQDQKRPEGDRLLAARVLAAVQGAPAEQALLAAVGHGDAPIRRQLRAIVAGARGMTVVATKVALDKTPAAEGGRRGDLLYVLASLGARALKTGPAAVAGVVNPVGVALTALTAALEGDASFEEKARAISGLGLIKEPQALRKLVDVREHHQDGVLRYLAVEAIATSYDGSYDTTSLPALRAALQDADPRVRETVAAALGQRGDKGAADLLIAGAKQEPWPGVRRAEVEALGQLCTPAGDELIQRALKRDVDEVRQVALVGLAHCYGAKANPALLQILGRLPESADMRSLAARLLAAHKDPATVPGLAEVLARLVREVEADMSLQTVIVDTAMALAAIRNPQAISVLAGLLSEQNVSVKRAAIDALALVCDPAAGAAALRKAAQDKDEAVSLPAAAAEAHCRDRR